MKLADFLSDCSAHGKALPGYAICDMGRHFNVFVDQKNRANVWACATQVFEVSGTSAHTLAPSLHNVVVAYYVDPVSREPQMVLWCGDSYFEGRAKDKSSRTTKALEAAQRDFSGASLSNLNAELAKGWGV
ncbi:MAG TPA: hypothetical protein VJ608_03920, partial [Albitalea sp.]|nr:hypothetical protein [Albitalea sp.]